MDGWTDGLMDGSPRRRVREHDGLVGLLVKAAELDGAEPGPPVHRASPHPLGLDGRGGTVVGLEQQVRKEPRDLFSTKEGQAERAGRWTGGGGGSSLDRDST